MIKLSLIFLQSEGMSGLLGMWPLLAMIVVFWWFILRPQNKKQKEQAEFMASMEKGDEVVLASGILGRINKIEGDIITLQVDTKTFIRVTRGAISKEMTATLQAEEATSE